MSEKEENDMDRSLRSLRELAERATPGPWFTMHGDGVVYAKEKTGDHTARYVTVARNLSIADSELIAACDPTTILSLLSQASAQHERSSMSISDGLVVGIDASDEVPAGKMLVTVEVDLAHARKLPLAAQVSLQISASPSPEHTER